MFALRSPFSDYEEECLMESTGTNASHELAEKLGELVRSERRITNEILKLINQGFEQRSYLDLGYPSMFEWLTKGFGYSNAAAYRRIQAANLLRSLPQSSQSEVSSKIEKGELNLTTLSKVQTTMKAQEKVSGKNVSLELKESILREVSCGGSTGFEKKSEGETQKLLFKLLPDSQSEILQDRKKVLSEDLTRHSITFTKEMSEDLKRVKEVLSHICPNGTDQEVIAYALKFLLKKKDPLKHKTLTHIASAAEATRVKEDDDGGVVHRNEKSFVGSFPEEDRKTDQNLNSSCTYEDPKTGKTCGSRYQLQIDHIIPKALGGSDTSENLRPLCRVHNIHAAEKIFGRARMAKYRAIR